MTSRIVKVPLGEQAYDIVIGAGLFERAADYLQAVVPSKRVVVITDRNVEALYYPAVKNALSAAGFAVECLAIAPGEGSKSFPVFQEMMEKLLALRPDRNLTLIALGGGVVGDLSGFMASVCLRGVPFVQVPTTLLAQVDSAVGGKTAINSIVGKNLIGSFYQPKLVLVDTQTLSTLPPREMKAGYSEIVKYGAIMDEPFFAWLESNHTHFFAGQADAVTHTIARSCEAKAIIVGADEREAGQRALLNFGHTFAHALEAEMRYDGRLLHGEAVAIGMVMAAELSVRTGHCSKEDAARLTHHLQQAGLPVTLPSAFAQITAETLLDHMRGDKKVSGSRIVFVLLKKLGEAFVANDVSENSVLETLRNFLR